MKITYKQLRRIIKEELSLLLEYGQQPLARSGGRHDRISGYHYDSVHGVHIRDDYDPRTDYGDELGTAVKKVQDEELRGL